MSLLRPNTPPTDQPTTKNTRTHQPDSSTHRYHSPPSIHPSPPLIKGLSWTFLVGSPQVIEKREKGKHTTKDSPFHPINSSPSESNLTEESESNSTTTFTKPGNIYKKPPSQIPRTKDPHSENAPI